LAWFAESLPEKLLHCTRRIVAAALFSWDLSNFANYDPSYGSLGAGIGLMMCLIGVGQS